MKTFDEIYEELKNGNNGDLINTWKKAKDKKDKADKISKTICLIVDLFALVIMFLNRRALIFPVSIIIALVIILFINFIIFIITSIVFSSKEQLEYIAKYKKIVINKLMNNFYDGLEYFPQKGMPEYIYKQPEYHECYDIYKSEDYFEAQIKNTYSIQMSEVLTQEEQEYKDSDGNTKTRLITKFNGLFAKVIMHKSINSKLKIMLNHHVYAGERLQMDSSEFEKYFDVAASNKIIGMQLLTADVMEELVQFENKTNMKFDIVINQNELYLRFHSGSMFEPDNFKKEPLNKETLERYFYMLNFTYNLSNKLINIINDLEI